MFTVYSHNYVGTLVYSQGNSVYSRTSKNRHPKCSQYILTTMWELRIIYSQENLWFNRKKYG